jgi:hypothetical protein
MLEISKMIYKFLFFSSLKRHPTNFLIFLLIISLWVRHSQRILILLTLMREFGEVVHMFALVANRIEFPLIEGEDLLAFLQLICCLGPYSQAQHQLAPPLPLD